MHSEVNNRTIAVSGGAGYLGRCVMDVLLAQGYTPICLDNYSRGHRFSDPRIDCFTVDLADQEALEKLWPKLPSVAAVIHFAAFALVGESVEKPDLYKRNNVGSTRNLATIAARENFPFLHSSSCAVYGVPATLPIVETAPLAPISPYGETKRDSEALLRELSQSSGLPVLNLRYFNPGGMLKGASHGERHDPETHLIPSVIRAAMEGRQATIFGDQYPTADGSCVRDFLHVEDLCHGHVAALDYLFQCEPGTWEAVNLGSGKGTSVLEVIHEVENVLGRPVDKKVLPARAGDPPELVADISKARSLLGWAPRRSLRDIVRSATDWEARKSATV